MALESLEKTLAELDMFRADGRDTVASVERFLRQQDQEMPENTRILHPHISLLLDALPAVFAAAQRLPNVISGPKITFRDSPLCVTFGFYIRGYHPYLGKTLVGYTGNETLVRYSIFPLKH